MSKMHAKIRNALPDSDFALIVHHNGKEIRKYPDNDLPHARDALSRAAAIGGSTEAKVDRKVYAKYPALKKRHDARK
jgi:hypothetical protein